MKAQEHSHYHEEKSHLRKTIDGIEDYLARYRTIKGHGADNRSAHAVLKNQVALVRKAEDTRNHLYFGRLDLAHDGDVVTHYLGHIEFMDFESGIQIFAWQDTILGRIYYGGEREGNLGEVHLKRVFKIDRDQLRTIVDEYVASHLLKDDGEESVEFPYGDSMLLRLLKETKSGRLSDIVRTIQAKQYEIIAAPAEQMLIVQGPPGSGKTQIALHRISYLLYHARSEPQGNLNVLTLGPNKLFMEYISGVLPALGERQIPQRALDEWLVELLQEPVRYQPQHESLETLLNPASSQDERTTQYRNDRNKGSLAMAVLLERYVEYLEHELVSGKEDLVVQLAASAVTFTINLPDGTSRELKIPMRIVDSDPISAQTIREDLHALQRIPLNQRRRTVEERIAARKSISNSLLNGAIRSGREYLESEFKKIKAERERFYESADNGQFLEELAELRRIYQHLLKELKTRVEDSNSSKLPSVIAGQVHDYLEEWTTFQATKAYRQLFRTPALLQRLGRGLFSSVDLALMNRDFIKNDEVFHFGDLAPLLFLQRLLEGNASHRVYDHLVVDEAQDLTPLQMKVLSDYSRSQSMTVLGDLRQGIYLQHGVKNWEVLATAPESNQYQVVELETSYRSTADIINFANEMLQRTGVPAADLVEPFARKGQPVQLRRASSRDDLMSQLVSLLNVARMQSRVTAVVCKTIPACRQLARDLARAGFSDYQLVETTETTLEKEVLVLPISLTKGLEFDQVIIADADEETYPADALHRNLLYVALTRAAHTLRVCWVGEISPLLDPDRDQVSLHEPFSLLSRSQPVTLEEYAKRHEHVIADNLVEKLAANRCLHLLENGQIDEAILDGLFSR